jgi:hypothetical protein
MTKLLKKGYHGVSAQLGSLDVQTSRSYIPMVLQNVINNHSKVFGEMPKGLPLAQDHDHVIHLQPGSVPPNIRPYRYTYTQKSEIERMVQEMLEARNIHPSQSAFSSLVVMVYKRDGSWRMCSYYRDLNKMAIKDKFLILVIDELLDELQGTIFFTKLYLHPKYHQIRMRQKEFLEQPLEHMKFMMSFFITNAPSTFQNLMISIFEPFLIKFVLLFFDDILIYNKSWEEHVQHVDMILKLLEEQQLYAEPSKCAFGVLEVKYLGHILSHEGIKVDPNKAKAMMERQIPKTLKNFKGF